MVVIMTGISFVLVFWFVILFSCLKVAARADRIMEAFLLGEEEYFGNQSERKQIKEAR